MSKKIISLSIFISLFCLAGFVFANITPPSGIPTSFTALLANIAKGVGTFIASLSVIMIIVAGIFYLLSAGNPQRMETAKKALIYAIIGIVIGLSANGIVDFVTSTIGGTGQ